MLFDLFSFFDVLNFIWYFMKNKTTKRIRSIWFERSLILCLFVCSLTSIDIDWNRCTIIGAMSCPLVRAHTHQTFVCLQYTRRRNAWEEKQNVFTWSQRMALSGLSETQLDKQLHCHKVCESVFVWLIDKQCRNHILSAFIVFISHNESALNSFSHRPTSPILS